MAEDSDGTLKAVVICEGDLHDPDFPQKFRSLLGKLKSILDPPKKKKRFLKVDKVEPWNSVRVTLSIPKDAATKLRQLAAEGNTALRALGILSVQLEGDTVISLRLVGQEIVLRTENENAQALDGQDRNSAVTNDLADLLACVPTPQNNQQSQQTICAGNNGEGPSLSTIKQQPQPPQQQQIIRANSIDSAINATNGPIDTKSIFKSPNTICPMDGKLPTPVPSNLIESREYPFESMTQARVIQRRENTMGQIQNQDRIRQNVDPTMQSTFPPPPYPGANINPLNTHLVPNKVAINQQQQQQPAQTSGNIAISSPLLVNLLQNESTPSASNVAKIPLPIQNINPNANIGQQTIIPNTQATIVKNGQEIVILSNNSMPHQPIQSPQINQTSNFVVPNSGAGAEIGFNKCVAISQQAQITKQTIQSPGPHHQLRVQQATFVNVSTVQATNNESIQQSQQNVHNSTNSSNNILTPPQQQTNSIVIAGNTPVPSTINSVNVNKIQQSRYPQPQAIPPTLQLTHSQQYQQFTNQPQMRSTMMQPCTPHSHPSQQPMGNMIQISPNQLTSTQGMPTQIVLQKHQMRAMHPNIMNQQQIIGTNMRQIEFRQSNPTNVVMQQNQMQPNQVQQFQQAQQQQPQVQTTSIMQTTVSGNALQTFNSQLGSQQISQQTVSQMDNTYNPRWPLKPMDSATQSSFQEFARYQMQYNLSQQQNSTDAESSIADHLADLDEITRTDLESLLPSINDTDLDSALELDIKAPLESLLDAKDLELDLIDPSVPTESIPQNTTNSCAPIVSGTGISQISGIGNSPLLGNLQPQSNTSLMHFQNQQQPQLNIQQQIVVNSNQFNKQQNITKRAVGPNTMGQHTNMVNVHQPMASGTLIKQQPKTHQMGQFRIEQKFKTSAGKEKQVLINPLTGELEPIPSEESGDELIPTETAATSTNNYGMNTSNIMYSDDDNSCSTGFSRASDYSDNDPLNSSEQSKGKTKRKEKKDSAKKPKVPKIPKGSLLKEKLQQGLKEKIIGKTKEKNKLKNVSSPIISNASIAEMSDNSEKIKLRLKLGKSEPESSAYKVDVSFGEGSKRVSALNPTKQTIPITSSPTNSVQSNASHSMSGSHLPIASGLATSEELRVPPLHISLRGRNSVVIKNSKKTRKKSQGGGEDEEKKSSNKKGHMRSMNIDSADTSSQKIVNINNASGVTISNDLHKNQIEAAKVFPMVETISGNDEFIKNLNVAESVEVKKGEAIEDRQPFALNQTQLDTMKRSHASIVTPNGPLNPEKKRRLSMGTAMPSSSIMTKMSEYSKSSQIMDSSVESIREAIGSTNVGTLPKHSQLMTAKVQKAANNNNNSLTPNKAKVTNKLKPKIETTDNLKLITGDNVPENVVNEVQNLSESVESNPANWHSSDVETIAPSETKSDANMKNVDLHIDSAVLSNQIQSKANESTANIINTTINGSIQKPLNVTTQNTQIINRLIDIKDSPRRDIIEGLINASHTIRCSPASQTQGEDSGIESMDALSEKSPHQTASPVANDIKNVEAIKEVTPKPAINDIDTKDDATGDRYSNIEAALAKMEGSNDFVTGHCDKNGVVMDIENDSQKLNGKNYNLENDEPVHRLVNDLVETNKVENSDIVIAGKNNECPNVENKNGDTVQNDRNMECKDMNENKTTTELNEIIADEKTCINITDNNSITLSSEAKNEMKTFDENRNDDKKIISVEPIKVESNQIDSQIFDQMESFESSSADVNILDKADIMDTSETDMTGTIDINEDSKEANLSVAVKSAEDKEIEDTMNAAQVESTQMNISSETNTSNILEQLSIEIPNHEIDGTQRVRTRASSKLESPLEVKQSPSDSPASCSVKNSNKAMKRKRQESESSIQSCVSDDTPTRGKKIRKSGDNTASSSRSSSPMNVLNGNDFENVSNRKFDSSDSDEPLIEVAGKVRNAKMNKAAIDGDKAILRNHLKSSNSQSPSGSTTQHSQLISGSQLSKTDDKANTMSTRRSVRMNATVAKVSKNATTNQNNQDQINTTTNLVTSSPNDGNTDQSRKSGNGTLANVTNSPESMDARRKTRSAGLEQTATESRRRRISRDNK